MPHPHLVHLSAAGVGVLVEVGDGLMPAVLHWGPALDPLAGPDGAAEAAAIAAALRTGTAPNEVDVPVRLSVLPEQATGWTGRPGVVGSRAGRVWSTRFVPTAVTLGGRELGEDEAYVAAGPALLETTAVDELAGLEVVLRLELLPTGLLRLGATLTSSSDDPEPFTLDGLHLTLPIPPEADELLDLAGRWGRERVPQRLPLRVGTHLREGRHGRTGADSALVLHAGTPGFGFADGDIWAVHTAWSGNHVHYAERLHDGLRVLGGGEVLLPGEVRLGAGPDDQTSYDSPWVYAAHARGLDAVAHRFHRHQRARPRPVSSDRPVTLNVWEAVYFDHDLERLLGLAELAAASGIERFVLDDGWFGARRDDHAGLGDWVVARDAWPDGLHPLVDRVRALGMQFGLWVEPEMVNPDSDVARAHPDWVMSARGSRPADWPKESRFQQVLDLGNPAAYAHVRDQLLAVLDEHEIAYLKWDHNRDLVEAGSPARGGRPGVHEQTLAAYRLMDELRAAHPGLEIESCSSGGARVDLGVLERTDRVWVSDCIDPLERQHMMRWTAQLVPPEYLGAHVASGRSHTTGRWHDLSFRAGTAVFGHLGVEWDLARASATELADLRSWITWFKAHRDLLLGGDLVRMDTHDPALFVHGVVAPDRLRAIFAIAMVGTLDAAPGPRTTLRGLDPTTRYRVRPVVIGTPPDVLQPPPWWGPPGVGPDEHGRYAGTVLSGAALQHAGLAAPVIHPENVILLEVESA